MKESEAWVILAEEFDADRYISRYLCNILNHGQLRDYNAPWGGVVFAEIPLALRKQMVARIEHALDHVGPAYEDRDEREARTLACLMFAEVAKDEEYGI